MNMAFLTDVIDISAFSLPYSYSNNNNSNLIRLITSSPEVTSHVFVTPLRMLLKKKTGEKMTELFKCARTLLF